MSIRLKAYESKIKNNFILNSKVMESYYEQVFSSGILRKIICFLPYNDQLHLRRVNKHWEDEASIVLKGSRLHRMEFLTKVRFYDFLLEFPVSSLPNKLLPLARVKIHSAFFPPKRLKNFALQHGASIRFLTILMPYYLSCPRRLEHEIKTMLQHFINLETLTIRCEKANRFESSTMEEQLVMYSEPDTEGAEWESHIVTLPRFENIRKLKLSIPSYRVDFFNEILDKVPTEAETLVHLWFDDVSPLEPNFGRLTSFRSLQSFQVVIKVNDLAFLSELMRLELYVPNSGLTLVTGEDEHEMTNEFRHCVTQHLRTLAESGQVQSLFIASYLNSNFELILPPEVTSVQKLSFSGDVTLTSPTQFPNLRAVCDNCGRSPFEPRKVLQLLGSSIPQTTAMADCLLLPLNLKTVVEKLAAGLEGFWPERSPTVALAESLQWPNHFPNLKILHVMVEAGTEEVLNSVFASLVNLEELKVQCGERTDTRWTYADPASLQCVLAGELGQILNDETPLDILVPSSELYTNTTARHHNRLHSTQTNMDPAQQPRVSIRNFQHLKILDIVYSPPETFYALANFTAIQKLPPLEKLKISTNKYEFDQGNPTYNPCRVVLESIHEQFILDLTED